MFNVGDTIVYTSCGLCKIDRITKKIFNGEEKEFYILKPLSDAKSTLQVQVNNPLTNIKLKSLLTRKEITEIINEIPNVKPYWIENENERKKIFSEIIRNGERIKILGVMISIIEHSKGLKDKGRKLHACDENYLNDAKKLISEEFSYVLEMTKEDIDLYLKNIIGTKE